MVDFVGLVLRGGRSGLAQGGGFSGRNAQVVLISIVGLRQPCESGHPLLARGLDSETGAFVKARPKK